MSTSLFYGMPGARGGVSRESVKRTRPRKSVTRDDKRVRLAAMQAAESVARAVRKGAEPDAELSALEDKVSPELFEGTLRVLKTAPYGVPSSVRELLTEQPEPAAPSPA